MYDGTWSEEQWLAWEISGPADFQEWAPVVPSAWDPWGDSYGMLPFEYDGGSYYA